MLKGERVTLRAIETSDAPPTWRWHRDHEFSVVDVNPYPLSLAAIEEFIRTLSSPSYRDVSLGIEDEARRLIGIVRMKRGTPEDRRADVGIAIERGRWNKGYGADATRTILPFVFQEMNLSAQGCSS